MNNRTLTKTENTSSKKKIDSEKNFFDKLEKTLSKLKQAENAVNKYEQKLDRLFRATLVENGTYKVIWRGETLSGYGDAVRANYDNYKIAYAVAFTKKHRDREGDSYHVEPYVNNKTYNEMENKMKKLLD